MKYSEVTRRYEPNDNIVSANGYSIGTILDYWKWAHSDLIDNTERGVFAEYIVACSIGGKGNGRINWNKFDLTSPEGIKVEVKTSAYLQCWGQDKFSTISFCISATLGYDRTKGSYECERKRQADVYVFCLHKEIVQEKLNPLDLTQWDFYILSVNALNENSRYSTAKSIGLKNLIKIGAVKCSYEAIHQEIVKAAHKN